MGFGERKGWKMPHQNRVDPFSRLHRASPHGLFTGNRGILHDPVTGQLRHERWACQGWVICTLVPFPGRVSAMTHLGQRRWTPLFFLDEAVGLAAGHRPCTACRREAALAFRDALGQKRIAALDGMITPEMKRYLRARSPEPRPLCEPQSLPDGAFFAIDGRAYVKWQGAGRQFRFDGYGEPTRLPDKAVRLTPQASCDALSSGFVPVVHPSIHRG